MHWLLQRLEYRTSHQPYSPVCNFFSVAHHCKRGDKNGFDLSNSILDSKYIRRGGPEKDGIFALTYPNFIPAKVSQLAGCERVLGVNLGGVSKPYPLSKLREYGKPCFTDELACQSIHIEWDDANNSAWITDTGGEAMASLTIFWFAWFTVHPETQIFEFIDNAKLKACQH